MADPSDLLNAGATGTVDLIAGITATTVADAIGSSAVPIVVTSGNVIVNSNFGNVYVTGTTATNFTATTTASVTGQTAAMSTNLSTTAGPLTIAGPTNIVNGGTITLTSTGTGGGVAVNAALGNTATGNITINAGSNSITINAPFTVPAGTTATLTATTPATIAATVTVSTAATLTATNDVQVNGTGTLAGSGTVNANVTDLTGGQISPGSTVGVIATNNLNLNAGSSLTVDFTGTTAGQFDQVNVTGTVSLTNANLRINVGGSLNIGDSFIVINNDGTDAVTGTFFGNTTINAANDPRYTFTLNYAGGDGNDVVATLTSIAPFRSWMSSMARPCSRRPPASRTI